MRQRTGSVIKLAERAPAHLAEVILRRSRSRLVEQRSPEKQTATAREYVRARTFLDKFYGNLAAFVTAVAFGILQAVLPYLVHGTMAWFEIAALGVDCCAALLVMAIALRRKARAQQVIEVANRAAGIRQDSVLAKR